MVCAHTKSVSSKPITFKDHFTNLKNDLPAGVVVFLVALPLCLGIAHASGVPPLAGVISGLVGGIIVSMASGSHTAVSGPAAGLIVIVLAAAEGLGYAGLLLATFLAGAMPVALWCAAIRWHREAFSTGCRPRDVGRDWHHSNPQADPACGGI